MRLPLVAVSMLFLVVTGCAKDPFTAGIHSFDPIDETRIRIELAPEEVTRIEVDRCFALD